jgi:hypothetical protein
MQGDCKHLLILIESFPNISLSEYRQLFLCMLLDQRYYHFIKLFVKILFQSLSIRNFEYVCFTLF